MSDATQPCSQNGWVLLELESSFVANLEEHQNNNRNCGPSNKRVTPLDRTLIGFLLVCLETNQTSVPPNTTHPTRPDHGPISRKFRSGLAFGNWSSLKRRDKVNQEPRLDQRPCDSGLFFRCPSSQVVSPWSLLGGCWNVHIELIWRTTLRGSRRN